MINERMTFFQEYNCTKSDKLYLMITFHLGRGSFHSLGQSFTRIISNCHQYITFVSHQASDSAIGSIFDLCDLWLRNAFSSRPCLIEWRLFRVCCNFSFCPCPRGCFFTFFLFCMYFLTLTTTTIMKNKTSTAPMAMAAISKSRDSSFCSCRVRVSRFCR